MMPSMGRAWKSVLSEDSGRPFVPSPIPVSRCRAEAGRRRESDRVCQEALEVATQKADGLADREGTESRLGVPVQLSSPGRLRRRVIPTKRQRLRWHTRSATRSPLACRRTDQSERRRRLMHDRATTRGTRAENPRPLHQAALPAQLRGRPLAELGRSVRSGSPRSG